MKYGCTFTGVDEYTDLSELQFLNDLYPRLFEFGVLFSFTRAGNETKYPSIEFIEKLCKDNAERKLPLAIHLCGSAARKFITLESAEDSIFLNRLVSNFDRIQLNINVAEMHFDVATCILRQLAIIDKPFIVQHNNNNGALLDSLKLRKHKKIHVLKDASGGQGIVSNDFSIPESCAHSMIGFAGGIGPDNHIDMWRNACESVKEARLKNNKHKKFWIDMETKIRTSDNKFDFKTVSMIALDIEYLTRIN